MWQWMRILFYWKNDYTEYLILVRWTHGPHNTYFNICFERNFRGLLISNKGDISSFAHSTDFASLWLSSRDSHQTACYVGKSPRQFQQSINHYQINKTKLKMYNIWYTLILYLTKFPCRTLFKNWWRNYIVQHYILCSLM